MVKIKGTHFNNPKCICAKIVHSLIKQLVLHNFVIVTSVKQATMILFLQTPQSALYTTRYL